MIDLRLMEKILHHFGCPKTFLYRGKKNISGIMSGAGFFHQQLVLCEQNSCMISCISLHVILQKFLEKFKNKVAGTIFDDFSFGRGMKHSDFLCVRRDFASQV